MVSTFHFKQKLQEGYTFGYPLSKEVILTLKCYDLELGLKSPNFASKKIAYFRYFRLFGTFRTVHRSTCHRTGRSPCLWLSAFHGSFFFGQFRMLYSLHNHLNPTPPVLLLNCLHFFHIYLSFHRLVDLFKARHACKLSRVVCFYGMFFFPFIFKLRNICALQSPMGPNCWLRQQLKLTSCVC
jgi:hypothetical protein